MTAVMADPVVALMGVLKGDGNVAALAGESVFGTMLPEAMDTSMPAYALVVRQAGGGSLGSGFESWGDQRFDVFCYGGDTVQARGLWRAVYAVMKPLTPVVSAGVKLMWARSAGGPTPLIDPDVGWPYVLSTWQVLLTEVPA